MKSFWKWAMSVVAAIAAALFLFKKKKKKKPEDAPPSHEVTEVFVEEINDDLEEELGKVEKATKGSNPAEELANLGNTRSRR
tara:strand:+ start:313 stop:558 length:246 start_codon:yes stop_codon:yes gene_type:complete